VAPAAEAAQCRSGSCRGTEESRSSHGRGWNPDRIWDSPPTPCSSPPLSLALRRGVRRMPRRVPGQASGAARSCTGRVQESGWLGAQP